MIKFKIGIIDDDSTKTTQIITLLLGGWSSAPAEKKIKYSAYELCPIEIPISSEMDTTSIYIKQNGIDCLIVDYRLSSYAKVHYTGIDLTNYLQKLWRGFPIFVLTSYEDDLYARELFDVYQVFTFDRYLNDADERVELNTKIIEQILKYKKERIAWEQELEELLPQIGTSAIVDSRIMELDGLIENSLDGLHSIPSGIKNQLSVPKIDCLLEKLDELLKKD